MDPYRILDIEPGADSREIIQSATLALRKRQYSGYDIASAQKVLLDPVKRTAQAFLYSLEPTEHKSRPNSLHRRTQNTKRPGLDLERLTCFDAELP